MAAVEATDVEAAAEAAADVEAAYEEAFYDEDRGCDKENVLYFVIVITNAALGFLWVAHGTIELYVPFIVVFACSAVILNVYGGPFIQRFKYCINCAFLVIIIYSAVYVVTR